VTGSTDSHRKRAPDLEVDVPASFAGFAHPEFLVETEWLEAHLGQSDLRILDCTVHIVFDPQAMFTIAPGRDDFERGHIPGAQFVDLLTELSDTSHPVPLMAPSPAQFASVMSRLGVENGCRVILYSAQNAYWATRVWWLFRVFGFDNAALLNGGWPQWRREERPIETGPARLPPPARFNVSELRPLMASKADVLAAIADPAVCIINALPEDQFLFTSGVHYGRPGHITGSLNVPSEDLLDSETNEFLPAAELRRRFERIGAFERPVITYCGGAIAASADAMALVMLGHPDVKLYDGSLLEWAADPSLPMEVDPIPTSSTQALAGIDNKRLLSELRDALDRQTATAEVLQVINRSPGNLAPVFEAILERALQLCEADFGVFWAYDGRQFRATSGRGMASELAEVLSRGPYEAHLDSPHARALAGEPLVHIADISGEGLYQSGVDPLQRALVDLGGARTVLAITLRRDASLLGILTLYRREVRLFADKHIVLVQSFAEQALVAMENARLITETREALEQQTATAEVLQVINSSPGELAPVFDSVLEKATELCEAAFGILRTWDGEHFHQVAFRGAPPALEAYWREPQLPTPGTVAYRLAQGENCVVIPDVREDQAYRDGARGLRALVELAGGRSYACVALRKDGRLFGALTIYRTEVRPFSDKQIALLQNFAAQAVIAMENARLLTETREALAQQTATAEVLQVINSSPGDLAPVFDAILEKAHSLCGIASGSMELYDGENFRSVAERGLPKAFADILREGYPASDNPATRPLIEGNRFTHIADLAETDYTITQSAAELLSARTLLCIPLRRENLLLGMIACARQEVRLFSEKEIALLESFAAQAVIAMDNARLLDEIRQRQAELRITFDNMGDGVAMFDSGLRLAAWNQNFQRILDLPDALLAARPSYADYIRFLAERGEFGADIEAELTRRLEEIGQELRFEHTRPDRRVIEVRRHAVPGRGFVVIYGDVTERKRAEEEIRTARDAAERALRELQAAQASLLHAQKMAALGQLTAGIAHEIKNPLNFVNNFAGLSVELLDELKETTAPAVASLGEETRAVIDEIVGMLTGNLAKIAEHGKRADGIVQSMLAHSRGTSGDRQRIDINALVEEALNLAYHGARAQDQNFNITLERDLDSMAAPVEVMPQDVLRVFLNLIGNGFYAANKRASEASDPAFKPSLKVITRDLGTEVEVRVRDNGTGIAPEAREKLFQPFFTTKPTGEGTGLGLSISWDIITQQHGGTIAVDSRAGEFAEFTIRLPRTHLRAAEAASWPELTERSESTHKRT
jgi:two-component system NtrC family sensor kinase